MKIIGLTRYGFILKHADFIRRGT